MPASIKTTLVFRPLSELGAALRAPHWVREAIAGEIAAGDYEHRVGDNFYRPLEWQPKAIVHANGQPAFESEEIGLFGHIVAVLARPMTLKNQESETTATVQSAALPALHGRLR